MSELGSMMLAVLRFGAALVVGGTLGYGVFRLVRWAQGPARYSRILAVGFAYVVAILAYGEVSLLLRAAPPQVQPTGPDSPPDRFVTLVVAVFIGGALLALLRRLPRKRPPGDSKPSGPGMTHLAP